MGLSQQAVSQLEQKETLDSKQIEEIAKILKVSPDIIKYMTDDAANNFINTFNDHSGFNFQCTFNPLDKYIEAMEDSTIMSIKKDTWLMLLRNNHKLALFTVNELMTNIAEFSAQSEMLRMMNAEEKYAFLKTHKSDILDRISQKHLASYLGTDTTYLSKIISNYKNNEEAKNLKKAI